MTPDFIVSTGVGSAFSLAEHKGEVVVLYFSFPGLPTYGLEAPALGHLQREFGQQGGQVVAINTAAWSSLEEWREFWRSLGADDVLWATDADLNVVKLYQVLTLGTTIIIDRQWHVSYRDGGATSHEALYSQVKELI